MEDIGNGLKCKVCGKTLSYKPEHNQKRYKSKKNKEEGK